MQNQTSSVHDFRDTRVLVIGDIMIDQYWFGEVKRISPEAPVPVVDLLSIEDRLGGAANVALNLKAMGANVDILGIAGKDHLGKEMIKFMEKEDINPSGVYLSNERRTTLKSRIMAQGQNLLRVDQEDRQDLSQNEWEEIKKAFILCCQKSRPDIVILQDYNKGLLTPVSIPFFTDYCNQHGIPTMVDPKKNNFFAYSNCTVFKPNKKEVVEALGGDKLESLESLHRRLTEKLSAPLHFVTLGPDGILVGSKQGFEIFPTKKRHIVDVCGAGDTVISILALYWTKKLDPGTIAKLANIGGGQVCTIAGVAPIDRDAFLSEVDRLGIFS